MVEVSLPKELAVDYLTSIILLISNTPFLFMLIIIWYFNVDEYASKRILISLFETIIIGCVLKEHFQAPPLPGHNGWSFPSGHAHLCATFWLNMLINNNSAYRKIAYFIYLVALAYAMNRSGYHYPSDIIAGYIYALITQNFMQIKNTTNQPYVQNMFLAVALVVSFAFADSKSSAVIIASSISLLLVAFFVEDTNTDLSNLLKKANLAKRLIANILIILLLYFIYKASGIIASKNILPESALVAASYPIAIIVSLILIPKTIINTKRYLHWI